MRHATPQRSVFDDMEDAAANLPFDNASNGYDSQRSYNGENYSNWSKGEILKSTNINPANTAAIMGDCDQIDIVCTAGNTTTNIELFNNFSSVQKIANASDFPAGQPTFTTAGNLSFPTAGTASVVSCPTYAYRAFFDSNVSQPFIIKFIRFSSLTASQQSNKITVFQKTFMGATIQNSINIKSYVDPRQMQTLIVDLPVSILIDGERGISFSLLASELVTLSLFISRTEKATLSK